MQNAHQILDVITAAFGTQILGADSQVDCARPETDYQELACQWRDVSGAYAEKTSANDIDPQWVSDMVKVGSLWQDLWLVTDKEQWLRKAQGLMSGMASNYNMPRLLLGLVVIVGAVAMAAAAVSSTVGSSVGQPPYLTIIILAHGAMMFASSYVEEEHHFWYWATTAWFGLLGFQSVKNR